MTTNASLALQILYMTVVDIGTQKTRWDPSDHNNGAICNTDNRLCIIYQCKLRAFFKVGAIVSKVFVARH